MMAATLSDFFQLTAREDRGCHFVDLNAREERWISYAEMYGKANAVAAKLRSYPLRSRFIAVLWMDPSPECLIALMAVVLANGIPVPVHAMSKDEEVLAVLEKVEADMLVLSARQAARIGGLQSAEAQGASPLHHICCIHGETGETPEPLQAIAGEWEERKGRPRLYTPPSETAMILMSSGSTGTPKGVLLSENNLLSNVDAIQDYLRLTEADRVLLTKSVGYISTITGEWLLSLLTGAHLVMTSGFFHPLHTVRFIRDYRVTFLCTVPSVLLPLVQSDRWQSDALSSLQKLIIVGGPMPARPLIQLQERLPWVNMMPCYGLTEASPRVSFLPAHALKAKANSAGIPIRGVEIGIYQEGKRQAPGNIGEIVVRGPGVMLGYYHDPQRTAAVLSAIGLRTADMGYMDEDGYLFITGRLDNALNIAGHTVYPEAMEKIIAGHPAVQEAAVAGMPDEVWGQLPVAWVVPDSVPIDEAKWIEELFAYCQERLSAIQRPKEIRIVEQLPKRANGKLDRVALKSMAKENCDACLHRTGNGI